MNQQTQEAMVRLEEQADALRGHVAELRHALEHVVEHLTVDGGCPDCIRLGQGALDYVGEADFFEQAYERHIEGL